MIRRRNSCLALLLLLALLLVLGGVLLQQHRAAVQAAQAEEARLARAAALRETYRYVPLGPLTDVAWMSTAYPQGDWLRYTQTAVLADISGEWEDYRSSRGRIYYRIPIQIVEVLYREEGMEVSEGSAWASVSSYAFWGKDRIQKGDRLILMGGKSRSGDYYKDQPLLTLSWIVSYYLSEDGSVMSMYDDPLVDALSGMQYEDFLPRILEIAEHSHALKQEKEEEA